MKKDANPVLCLLLGWIFYSSALFATETPNTEPPTADNAPLKVAVVGGLELCGVWSLVKDSAEKALNMPIETVLAQPKADIVPAFIQGQVDFLLIHGGDETFALQGMGYATPLRTVGYNEFAIVGPSDDPAGIASVSTGREAVLKLQATQQPVIAFRDVGSFSILQRLLKQADLTPSQLNLIPDSAVKPQQILRLASEKQAYVLVGHIPVAFSKMSAPNMKILLSNDSSMRRAYVIVTPSTRHPASPSARANAERLADYLLSDAGQQVLSQLGTSEGVPWIFSKNAGEALLPVK